MRWLLLLVTLVAAYRLRATPLAAAAVALAGVQGAHALLVVVAGRTGRRPGTLMTASGHLVAALGLFFLFVSFAL